MVGIEFKVNPSADVKRMVPSVLISLLLHALLGRMEVDFELLEGG